MENKQDKCDFCDRGEVKGRMIDKNENWYAFVPNDPEIFGHIILTTDKFKRNCPRDENSVIPKCPLEISEIDDKNAKIFKEISEKLIYFSIKLKKIDKVEKVYVFVAGETGKLHVHYHLIPRYEFKSYDERKDWADNLKLKSDDPKWVEFYKWPTKDFKYKQDLRYLGEVEQKYNDCKNNEYCPIKPSKEILVEITNKINNLPKE